MRANNKASRLAGRDDDRSYSEGRQPSTGFVGTLELPLEETCAWS
jgi:hypothetical protein